MAARRPGTPNNDVLLSQAAGDTLAGGAGDDVYDIIHVGIVVEEGVEGGEDEIIARVDIALPDHVENLTLDYHYRGPVPQPATRGPLVGIGNGLDNFITGNVLDNLLRGLGGDDVIRAGGGDDWVEGGTGNDVLDGQAGNDTLDGGAGNDRLNGGIGDDILRAGGGEDRLIGGDGLDIAIFDGPAANYRITHAWAATATVTDLTAPAGNIVTATLDGVELALFGFDVVAFGPSLNGGFDEQLYLERYGDVAAAVRAGVFANGEAHFDLYGKAEGRDPNALFDTGYYLAHNPDVAAAVATGAMTAWGHYLSDGWWQGRDPSAFFSSQAYLLRNPDVAGSGMNPLLHFLQIGTAEGRLAQLANPTYDLT